MTFQSDTIMIVDDEPQNISLLYEMLSRENYHVVAFPSGQLALQAAQKEKPDMILLDIRMPGMNGYEVCQNLKANTELKDVPILFLSALTEIDDKVRAFEAGGIDYVDKPLNEREVLARIKTHLRLRKHELHLEELVQEQLQKIMDAQTSVIFAIAKLAESRDPETGQHLERVQVFCKLLACAMAAMPGYAKKIDNHFIDLIFQACVLHDIGKVGIPDHILLKPGKLTAEEYDKIKKHTLIGSRTLEAVHAKHPGNEFVQMGIEIARSHHERWDGKGYPDGLRGNEIPLSAAIMSVADVYDAVRLKRPYKSPFSHEQAVEIICAGSGFQFSPDVVAAFKSVSGEFKNAYAELKAWGRCN